MTSPATFAIKHSVTAEDFQGFECSLRSTPIDYVALKKVCNDLVGGETSGTAFAVKLCLHGSRIKEGDYVQIKGQKLTFKSLLETLKKQEDYKADASSQGKDVNKTVITIRRICRIYASNVSHLILKKMVAVPADLKQFAKDTGLPDEFCFLDSCYGMSKSDLIKHGAAFLAFCKNFDAAIKEAYSKGWIQGVSGRSHHEAAMNYLKWRNIAVKEVEEADDEEA